jgi:dihydroxy-acid dehydratase
MEDLHSVGGTPALLKYLQAQNFIDGSCMTCTTHTLATNLEQCPELRQGQDVILPVEAPVKKTGHLQILYGNLAPDGSVAKITGKEGLAFSGPAAVYNGARCRMHAAHACRARLRESLRRVCRGGRDDRGVGGGPGGAAGKGDHHQV